MAEQRKNDMFLNVMSNPTYTSLDFMDVGLTAENTNLLPYDKYKENEQIRSNPLFADDNGNFDENIFKAAYDKAQLAYYDMATSSMNEQIAKEMEFQPGSLFAMNYENPTYAKWDAETVIAEFGKDTKFGKLDYNPDRRMKNVQSVGSDYEGKYTPMELAEKHKTYNPETGAWEAAPEEWFGEGWLKNIFNPEVMATYEKDDPEVISGQVQEGAYKINPETGTYYAERLNGRPTYNKQVISFWDTLTKEDSWINRYDFFDSDDKNKSVAGSIFKSVATVLPMFIPGVGPIYTGLSVGWQLGKTMAGLSKMIAGTDVGWINNMDGFLSQFDPTVSQHSQQHTWTIENLLNMGSMVFTQLAQQRWIFEQAPKMFGFKYGLNQKKMAQLEQEYRDQFYNTLSRKHGKDGVDYYKKHILERTRIDNLIKTDAAESAAKAIYDYRKQAQGISSVISKLFMTGMTTMDSYNEAKLQGATDEQAALLALGYSIGEYGILSTGIGEWIMPELRANRQFTKGVVSKLIGVADEAKKSGAFLTKEGRTNFAKKAIKFGKDLFDGTYHGGRTISAIAANSLGEGIEEMSEELLYDANKSLWNAYYWLTGSDMRYDAWKDMGNRYAMSFLGGLFGGGIFGFKDIRNTFGALENMTPEMAHQQVIYMLRHGQRGDIEKVLNRYTFAPKALSSELNISKDGHVSLQPGDDLDNMDRLVKNEFRRTLDIYEGILKSEGLNKSDDELMNEVLPDLRYHYLRNSTSAAIHMKGYQDALSEVIKAYRNKMAIEEEHRKSTKDSDRSQDDSEYQAKILAADKRIEEAREKAQSYKDGEMAKKMMLRGTYEFSKLLNGSFNTLTPEAFIRYKTGKNRDELNDNELEQLMTEWRELQESGAAENLENGYDYFIAMVKAMNPMLTKMNEDIYAEMEQDQALNQIRKQIDLYSTILRDKNLEVGSGMWKMFVQSFANPNALYEKFEAGKYPVLAGSDLYGSAYATSEEGAAGRLEVREEMARPSDYVLKRWKDQMIAIDPANESKYNDMSYEQMYDFRYGDANKAFWEQGDRKYQRMNVDLGVNREFLLNYLQNTMVTLRKIANRKYLDPVSKQSALRLIRTIESLMTNEKYDMGAVTKLNELIGTQIENVDNMGEGLISDMESVILMINGDSDISKEDKKILTGTNDKGELQGIALAHALLKDISQRFKDGVLITEEFDENGNKFDVDIDQAEVDETKLTKWAYSVLHKQDALNGYQVINGLPDVQAIWSNVKEKLADKIKSDEGFAEIVNTIDRNLETLQNSIESVSNDTIYTTAGVVDKSELGDIRDKIASLDNTPLIDMLDNLVIDDKGTKASKALANIEEAFKTASTNINGFVLNGQLYEAASNILSAMRHTQAVVNASREDGASEMNPLGFVNLYNKLMKDTDGFTPMNTIRKDFAVNLTREISRISSRLDMILKLSNANASNKMNENKDIEINKLLVTKKSIEQFINALEKSGVDVKGLRSDLKKIGMDDFCNKFETLINEKKPFNSTEEDLKKALQYSNDMEKIFHNFIASMGNNFNDETIRRVIDEYDPFASIVEDFSRNTRSFDSNTSLWYIASLIAADPEAVNDALLGAYQAYPDIAPIASQLMGIKGMLSYIVGRPIYERFSAIFKQSVRNKVQNILQGEDSGILKLNESLEKLGINIQDSIKAYMSERAKPDDKRSDDLVKHYSDQILFGVSNSNSFNIFDGIYMIGGTPGSGKTHAIAKMAMASLLQAEEGSLNPTIEGGKELFDPGNFLVVSTENAIDPLANDLQGILGREITKDERLTHNELLDYLFGVDSVEAIHGTDDRNIVVDVDNGNKKGDYIAHSTVELNNDDNKKYPKLIFIDEVSLLDQISLDAISRAAKQKGIMIIAFGDEVQIAPKEVVKKIRYRGYNENDPDSEDSIFITDEGFDFHMAEAQFPRAPKNGVSMRTNNTQKDVNLVRVKEETIKAQLYEKIDPIELHYADLPDGFYGEKIDKIDVHSSNIEGSVIEKDIDRMISDVINGRVKDMGVVTSGVRKFDDYMSRKIEEVRANYGDEYANRIHVYKEAVDTQGLEHDYYVFLHNNPKWNNDSKSIMRELYTVISRSKQGTVVYHTADYGSAGNVITSKRDDSTIRTGYDPEIIRAYTENYLSIMAEVMKEKKFDKLKVSDLKPVNVREMGTLAPVRTNGTFDTFGVGKANEDEGTPPKPPVDENGNPVKETDESHEPDPETGETEPEDGSEADGTGIIPTMIDMGVEDGQAGVQRMDTLVYGNDESKPDTYAENVNEYNDIGSTDNFGPEDSLGYTHSVDEIGANVDLNVETNKIAISHRNVEGKIQTNSDSTGLNGISKILAYFEKVASISSEATKFKQKAAAKYNKLVFKNADEKKRFLVLSRKYLHDMKYVVLTSNGDLDKAKKDMINLTTAFIKDVYGDEEIKSVNVDSIIGNIFNNSNFLFGIRKTTKKTSYTDANGKDKDIPSNQQESLVFESEMNVNAHVPSLRMDMQVVFEYTDGEGNKQDCTLIDLSLFTMENIISKLNQGSYQAGIVDWAQTNRNSQDDDTKKVANIILELLTSGTISGHGDITTLNEQLDLLKNYNKISGTLKQQLNMIADMAYIYKQNEPCYIPMNINDAIEIFKEARYIPAVLRTQKMGYGPMYINDKDYAYDPKSIDLGEIASVPHFSVSPIYISDIGIANSQGEMLVERGVPFVIIGEDPNLKGNEGRMINYYIEAIEKGVTDKMRIYKVIPPKFEVEDFVDKVYDIMSDPRRNKRDKLRDVSTLIGNISTISNMFMKLAEDSANGEITIDSVDSFLKEIGINENSNKRTIFIPSRKKHVKELIEQLNKLGESARRGNEPNGYDLSHVLLTMLTNIKDNPKNLDMLKDYNWIFNRMLMTMMFSREAKSNKLVKNKDSKENVQRFKEALKRVGFTHVYGATRASKWVELDNGMRYSEVANVNDYAYEYGSQRVPFTVYGKMDTGVFVFNYGGAMNSTVNRFKNNKDSYGIGNDSHIKRNKSIQSWINYVGSKTQSSQPANQPPQPAQPTRKPKPAKPKAKINVRHITPGRLENTDYIRDDDNDLYKNEIEDVDSESPIKFSINRGDNNSPLDIVITEFKNGEYYIDIYSISFDELNDEIDQNIDEVIVNIGDLFITGEVNEEIIAYENNNAQLRVTKKSNGTLHFFVVKSEQKAEQEAANEIASEFDANKYGALFDYFYEKDGTEKGVLSGLKNNPASREFYEFISNLNELKKNPQNEDAAKVIFDFVTESIDRDSFDDETLPLLIENSNDAIANMKELLDFINENENKGYECLIK